MTTSDENKAFVKEMLGLKRQLTDYPDRFDLKITMHEPQMYIAEQFTFAGRKLVDVRVRVCDAPA